MDTLLDTIRAAAVADATDEAKAAGATACRTILAALEANAGAPLAAAVPDANPIAAAVSVLRGVSPEQLLDLAIARLRAALPAGETMPAVQPMKFHIVPVPPSVGRRS